MIKLVKSSAIATALSAVVLLGILTPAASASPVEAASCAPVSGSLSGSASSYGGYASATFSVKNATVINNGVMTVNDTRSDGHWSYGLVIVIGCDNSTNFGVAHYNTSNASESYKFTGLSYALSAKIKSVEIMSCTDLDNSHSRTSNDDCVFRKMD